MSFGGGRGGHSGEDITTLALTLAIFCHQIQGLANWLDNNRRKEVILGSSFVPY